MKISVVIPTYKCSAFIDELVLRLEKTLTELNSEYEIIFVNDQSPEHDWQLICQLANVNSKIKGIDLSRNFGQHYAITAGLSYSTGEWIVVMDGDLQDLPEEISKLYEKALEGFDIVCGQRIRRQDKYFKKLSSQLFYKAFSYLTDTKQDESIANFGIYHRKVIDSILLMKDHIRYFPTMVQWVGFKKSYIVVNHSMRSHGNSGYSFYQLLKLAFDNIIAFSDKPLRLMVTLGMIITLFTLFGFIYTIIQSYLGKIEVLGYSSLILSVWMFSGIIIFLLGIIGIYLGKTFEKVKNRPTYIIGQKVNIHDDK